MTKKDELISIVMPAFNASSIIRYSITLVKNILEHMNTKYEILVIDDGSSDNTFINAVKLADNDKVRVYRLHNNVGKGFALIYGFRKSRGDVIIFFDSDLDINPMQIYLLVKAIRSTNADVVITNKWHSLSKTTYTFTRWFLSRSFNALIKLLLGLKVNDTQTGAKAFRRYVLENVVPKLIVKKYAFDVELLLTVINSGYKVIEIPAPWGVKLTSKFKVKEIWRMVLDLLAITYRYRVKKQYR